MRYLLDTDTCIYIANRRPAAVLAKFKQEGVLQIGVSIVTEYELYFGAVKSAQKERNMASLTRFFERVSVITWDSVAAHESAQIRADLESQGLPIGAYDLLIAGHALSRRLILVTNNEKEFGRVPGLPIENWFHGGH